MCIIQYFPVFTVALVGYVNVVIQTRTVTPIVNIGWLIALCRRLAVERLLSVHVCFIFFLKSKTRFISLFTS